MSTKPFRFYLLCLLTLNILWTLLSSELKQLHAQGSFALPSDLIFSTGQVNTNGLPQAHNILARLDARTGQVSNFYMNPSASFLKAIAWSPDGDSLAFIQAYFDGKNYSSQLCLLNPVGALQGCFEDAPIGYFPVYNPNGITWSTNGDRLYYIGGSDKVRRLLEADVRTFKTLRSIYEYPVPEGQQDNPPVLAWSNDLSYLTIGAGDNTRVQQGLPVLLIDIKTNQTIDLARIPGTEGTSAFVVCPYFSPSGTFLTAHNFDVPETPAQPQFLVLNKQGAIVFTLKPTAPLNAFPTSCPVWQADEKAFYFPFSQGTQQSSTLHILKYSLGSKQITESFTSGQLNNLAEATIISRITLSPDERFLVFVSPFASDMNIGTQVTVISLTGMLQRYSTPFRFSSDPLWSPAPVKPR